MQTLVKVCVLFLAFIHFGYGQAVAGQHRTSTTSTKSVDAIIARVIDGDTVVVTDSRARTYHLRMAGIDAPEHNQPYGQDAKNALHDLSGAKVRLLLSKHDRYGRYIGIIKLNGTDICLRQIRQGWAWHYKKYANEQSAELRRQYAEAEITARNRHIGLWQDAAPTPPWEFRRMERKSP